MKYHVTIAKTEIYVDSVSVEAESEQLALEAVRRALDAGEYEVDESCYSRCEIEIGAEPYDQKWHDDITLQEAVRIQLQGEMPQGE